MATRVLERSTPLMIGSAMGTTSAFKRQAGPVRLKQRTGFFSLYGVVFEAFVGEGKAGKGKVKGERDGDGPRRLLALHARDRWIDG